MTKPKLEDVNKLAEAIFDFIKLSTDDTEAAYYAVFGIATQLACMGGIEKENYLKQAASLHDFYWEKVNGKA